INNEIVGLITLVGLITIGLSTYLILYSHQIFDIISPALSIFQRKKKFAENEFMDHKKDKFDVVIIGLGRFGNRLAEMLDCHPDIKYLGVDFDPSIIKEWKSKGKDIIYGDMEDTELLDQIPFEESKVFISTVSNTEI